MRSTLLTAIAVLAFAAPASAGIWTDTDVQTAIRVGDTHWPASPCAGHQTIQWVDETVLQQAHPDGFPGQTYTGDAAPDGSCTIRIAWAQVAHIDPHPAFLCSIIEHEFGHLAGYGHSPNPNDPMYAASGLQADCLAALPIPPTRRQIEHAKYLVRLLHRLEREQRHRH